MSPPDIWMQTLHGRAFDLLEPTADMVDLLGEVAEVLARVPRFGGHTETGPLSVAQHCVMGAEAILAETGDMTLARAFLLHDGHEAYMGDITTPVAQALARRTGRALATLMPNAADQARRTGQGLARDALKGLKLDIDRAIFAAAGMAWPLAPEVAVAVLEWDLRMLALERQHLMAPPPFAWADAVECAAPARLRGRLRPWPWTEAADRYRAALIAYFPHLAARAA